MLCPRELHSKIQIFSQEIKPKPLSRRDVTEAEVNGASMAVTQFLAEMGRNCQKTGVEMNS